MKTAVYAGTFDPVTYGHLDVAERATKICDQLIIAVAEDNYKNCLFSLEERRSFVEEATKNLPNVRVDSFDGLLVDYCLRQGGCAIIRGLRAVSDFDKELQMALMNRKMCPQIDTVFLMSASKYLFISSSIIKNSVAVGGDISYLVTPLVEEALRQKYN
ncbi:MAG: pantetheine-phosphate adenylyltransferase [Clostridiales bacterium]|jgi:pantetheine-phosphate adenylyltransferase|nr:pantetheine-phosphate adenylyltransferase [Clostridiales bacterium]